MKENNYYNKTVKQLYEELDSNINGLSDAEASKRLGEYGENKLAERKKKSNVLIFLSQFNDLMILLLIFASIFSAVISYIQKESYADSVIILIIVVINATLSFIEEKKADKAIEELNKMFITNNNVIRDGKKETIDVRKIVPGDIIELEAGDYVSADARIISSEALEVNESTLTGESKSIKKDSSDITDERELYERKNMVYAGCNVTNGHAFVIVCSTAMNTELGKIGASLMNNKNDLTPLQKKINQISKVLTYIVIAIIIVMMIVGLLKRNDFFDILMLSISLAVAAIPEGMSSVITIILSLGMSEMAKRNVIIRKMSSVETLGSTDIICSDKTGTITENKMQVKSIYVNNKLYTEKEHVENINLYNYCLSCCQNVTKNNDKYLGDETEVAIYKYLEEEGLLINVPRVKEFPFDSDRKMMSTVNMINDKEYSFTKGSLDSILSNCTYYLEDNKLYNMTSHYKEKIFKIEEEESEKSLRILALAYKNDNVNNPEKDMIFLGLIGMMDPPRASVPNAINTCKNSGIKIVMITGDSINTARAIAKSVGIIDNDEGATTGKVVDKMTDDELREAVKKYNVYARISPSTKLRIVDALQSNGYVVAMTGDGVNDAPAIQKADIGIGMGVTGTEVVKKVADCILVDDSFSTIVDGVEEGRRITANIKKIILYLLAGNIVEVFLVFISMVLNMEMFTTLQLLWINLVTDSIPAIMLAFEKKTEDQMENTLANKYNESFFTPLLVSKIVMGAIIKSVVMLTIFIYFVRTVDVSTAGSLLFIYLVTHELLFAFSCRNIKKSVLNKDIFSNKKLTLGVFSILIIQVLVLVTPLSKYFIVPNIKISYILITIGICLIMFILGELIKPVYTKLFKDYREVKNEK